MDGFRIDTSELDQLAADLQSVPQNAGSRVRSAVETTARNIKDQSAASVGKRRHFRQAASAIDYEITGTASLLGSKVDAEIGYNKSHRSGRLGNLIEYGAPGSRNALAPTSDLRNALEDNVGDFEHGLDTALKDAERSAGL